jgi:hypothetical protein
MFCHAVAVLFILILVTKIVLEYSTITAMIEIDKITYLHVPSVADSIKKI